VSRGNLTWGMFYDNIFDGCPIPREARHYKGCFPYFTAAMREDNDKCPGIEFSCKKHYHKEVRFKNA